MPKRKSGERGTCCRLSRINEFIMIKSSFLISLFVISLSSPMTALSVDSLHQAAHSGDIESVRTFLKNNVDPDERDSFGGTALHAAMFQKNTEIIMLLISYGFDVNAQGLVNGYTPLHDAVWANNLEAVKILLTCGARTDLRAKDGLTPYEKAKKEDKKEVVGYMESGDFNRKRYDHKAKTMYSQNDVKAFVYSWFAGFDHQADIDVFKKHLPLEKVDMYFPDFPISSLSDFERWDNGVRDHIRWNAHHLLNLKVSGDEIIGFSISLDVNWKAKTYNGESYDMNIHQDWIVKMENGRNLVIEKHRARVINKQ